MSSSKFKGVVFLITLLFTCPVLYSPVMTAAWAFMATNRTPHWQTCANSTRNAKDGGITPLQIFLHKDEGHWLSGQPEAGDRESFQTGERRFKEHSNLFYLYCSAYWQLSLFVCLQYAYKFA